MPTTYTPRSLTNAIKKILKKHEVQDFDVSSQTTSFSGLGYGSGCTADVSLLKELPQAAVEELAKLQKEFQKNGKGPKFSENLQNAYIIRLGGPPYPFRANVRKLWESQQEEKKSA